MLVTGGHGAITGLTQRGVLDAAQGPPQFSSHEYLLPELSGSKLSPDIRSGHKAGISIEPRPTIQSISLDSRCSQMQRYNLYYILANTKYLYLLYARTWRRKKGKEQ